MTSKEIRKAFLDFFASKGHTIVPSAPMVVKNDPTLMFTNAGMNQFKDFFLGNSVPRHKRVADSQKCLRAHPLQQPGSTRKTFCRTIRSSRMRAFLEKRKK